jgi:hypothetical protein
MLLTASTFHPRIARKTRTPFAAARLLRAGEQFLLDPAESETVNGPEQN